MNACVGPVRFPAIQVGLRVLQALEALAFERRPLCVANTRFYFAFAIRVLHSAWKRCDAVVLQHVTVQRIERGLINVGREHAFAEIIEHHNTSDSTEPAKSFLMQLGPNTRTGTEHQEANSFSAISQRQDEQTRAPILAR